MIDLQRTPQTAFWCDDPPPMPWALSDPQLLKGVLIHRIAVAIKFLANVGTIYRRVARIRECEPILRGCSVWLLALQALTGAGATTASKVTRLACASTRVAKHPMWTNCGAILAQQERFACRQPVAHCAAAWIGGQRARVARAVAGHAVQGRIWCEASRARGEALATMPQASARTGQTAGIACAVARLARLVATATPPCGGDVCVGLGAAPPGSGAAVCTA